MNRKEKLTRFTKKEKKRKNLPEKKRVNRIVIVKLICHPYSALVIHQNHYQFTFLQSKILRLIIRISKHYFYLLVSSQIMASLISSNSSIAYVQWYNFILCFSNEPLLLRITKPLYLQEWNGKKKNKRVKKQESTQMQQRNPQVSSSPIHWRSCCQTRPMNIIRPVNFFLFLFLSLY